MRCSSADVGGHRVRGSGAGDGCSLLSPLVPFYVPRAPPSLCLGQCGSLLFLGNYDRGYRAALSTTTAAGPVPLPLANALDIGRGRQSDFAPPFLPPPARDRCRDDDDDGHRVWRPTSSSRGFRLPRVRVTRRSSRHLLQQSEPCGSCSDESNQLVLNIFGNDGPVDPPENCFHSSLSTLLEACRFSLSEGKGTSMTSMQP